MEINDKMTAERMRDKRIEKYRTFENLHVKEIETDKPTDHKYLVACDFCGGTSGSGHLPIYAKEEAIETGMQAFKLMASDGTINICDSCASNSVQEIIDWPYK